MEPAKGTDRVIDCSLIQCKLSKKQAQRDRAVMVHTSHDCDYFILFVILFILLFYRRADIKHC